MYSCGVLFVFFWDTAVVGNLGLNAGIAAKLGAEPRLFQIVQLAVLLLQEAGLDLALPIGSDKHELLNELQLDAAAVESMAEAARNTSMPPVTWESPAKHALLPDLLRLAIDNRQNSDGAWLEGPQRGLRLGEALILETT